MTCSCGLPSQDHCQEAFETVLTKEYADFRYARTHRLTVDTYSLQHPHKYMVSAKSFAAHLTGICCTMVYGTDPDLLKILQKWLNGKKTIIRPAPPTYVGDLTIAHVLTAETSSEHYERVREWATDVWQAYDAYHDLAKEWVEAAKRQSLGRRRLFVTTLIFIFMLAR